MENKVKNIWLRLADFPTLRLHNLLYNLLYPAFLGTLIYNYFDKYPALSTGVGVTLFLMLILFSLDFIYSLSEEVIRNYSGWQFVFDIFIVGLLFIAAKSITESRTIFCLAPWAALAASRAIAACWEEYEYWKEKKSSSNHLSRRHANSDWFLAALYCLIGLLGLLEDTAHYVLFLAPLLVVDILFYCFNMSKPGLSK